MIQLTIELAIKINYQPLSLNLYGFTLQSPSTEDEIEEFYATLDESIQIIPNRGYTRWMVKHLHHIWNVVGKYEIENRNERDSLVSSIFVCLFQHREHHLYTLIRYIIIKFRWR